MSDKLLCPVVGQSLNWLKNASRAHPLQSAIPNLQLTAEPSDALKVDGNRIAKPHLLSKLCVVA